MKILMVSMFANHFFNWTNQLKDSGHQVYWIDVFDNGSKVENIDWVHQTVNWKRKFDFPGRQALKKNLPGLYQKIKRLNEKSLAEIFEEKIIEIEPDVVQSFVLFSACAPILDVMKKYQDLKWIYSAWGNDLFFFQSKPDYLKDIKEVLPRVDFMYADCYRDFIIAKENGFNGEFLGVYPGGGGFDFTFEKDIETVDTRKIILVKGYQRLFGECTKVIEALQEIENEISGYEIVIFGVDRVALDYIEHNGVRLKPNFTIYRNIGRGELMKLMGRSLIYIGNSISDGTPNTMLEAMIMGAFPIQSNPGGATQELIENGKNGYLIEDPFDILEIKNHILKALENRILLKKGVEHNFKFIKPNLERAYVRKQVLEKYLIVEKSLKT